MTEEQKLKGILVNFYREGTMGDYLTALNVAIEELIEVKNLTPIVVRQAKPEKFLCIDDNNGALKGRCKNQCDYCRHR